MKLILHRMKISLSLRSTALSNCSIIPINRWMFILEDLKVAVSKTKLKRLSTNPVNYELEVAKTPVPKDITISDFSIDYKAAVTINFAAVSTVKDKHLFYHVTPFGYAEIAMENAIANDEAEKIEKYTLLHDVLNNGELYMGLNDAEPDSVITLLFEVADGSSNPLKEAEKLSWYYLSGNVWIQFKNRFVVDRTHHFNTIRVW